MLPRWIFHPSGCILEVFLFKKLCLFGKMQCRNAEMCLMSSVFHFWPSVNKRYLHIYGRHQLYHKVNMVNKNWFSGRQVRTFHFQSAVFCIDRHSRLRFSSFFNFKPERKIGVNYSVNIKLNCHHFLWTLFIGIATRTTVSCLTDQMQAEVKLLTHCATLLRLCICMYMSKTCMDFQKRCNDGGGGFDGICNNKWRCWNGEFIIQFYN